MNLLGLILLSLGLGLAAWLGFVWSVRSGQYDDPEGPKYRMLDDEEEEGPPPAKPQRPAEEPRPAEPPTSAKRPGPPISAKPPKLPEA